MQYRLSAPQHIRTALRLPASKSISNRVLILHALSHGHILPTNLSDCDDTRVTVHALRDLPDHIDIGAAGTAMRFLTAYLCTVPGTHTLTGTARMQQRPIRILVDALRTLGASIGYVGNEGFPPLHIQGGGLHSGCVTLAGNVSSQYISALLMIGPVLSEGLRLRLTGEVISRPYINLTLQLMREFGAEADWTSKDSIEVRAGGYRDIPFTVESDWSAASYWYEMLALSAPTIGQDEAASVELYGLFPNSHQGDSRGAELFARLGIHTEYTDQGVRLTRRGIPAARLDEDLIDIPDLAQTFVVTCCLKGIPFRFTGLQSLKIKETDRITALTCELRKLGFVVRSEEDGVMQWEGERCEAIPSPLIATYEDHRMAMAFAPASLLLPDIRIDQPQVVSKSYPAYWDDLRRAGFEMVSIP